MKKLLKIIFGLLGILITLVIILGVVLGIMLYDSSHKRDKTGASSEESVEILNYNALTTAKADNQLSYLFDELSLNSLLEGISNEINLNPLKILNIYTTYDNLNDDNADNDYLTLYVPVKIYFYESCLISTINVKQDGNNFILEISKASLGKVNTDFFLVSSIVKSCLDPKNVQNELNKNGYSCTCEYKNNAFCLTVSIDDILNIIEKNVDNNSLFKALLSVFKRNNDLYQMTFSGKDKGFIINLDKLASVIEESNSFELNSNPSLNSIAKAESLLLNNKIDKKQAHIVTDYLIRGYQNLESEDQKIIKLLDLSSIGISLNEAYTGVVERKNTNIISAIKSSTSSLSLLSHSVNVNLDDENINAIIDDAKVIGKTFSFIKNNKINYITIGNIFIKTLYHQVILSTIVDFNGNEIQIDVTLDANDLGSNHAITTVLSKVEIGEISLNDDEQKNLLEFLSQNIESELIKINKETKEIKFDFSTYFDDASLIEYKAIKNHLTNTLEVFEGYIQVKVKVSI